MLNVKQYTFFQTQYMLKTHFVTYVIITQSFQ